MKELKFTQPESSNGYLTESAIEYTDEILSVISFLLRKNKIPRKEQNILFVATLLVNAMNMQSTLSESTENTQVGVGKINLGA